MQQTTSPAGASTLEEAEVKEHSTPSTSTSPELTEVALRQVAVPIEKTSRSYAALVRYTKATAFKMTDPEVNNRRTQINVESQHKNRRNQSWG